MRIIIEHIIYWSHMSDLCHLSPATVAHLSNEVKNSDVLVVWEGSREVHYNDDGSLHYYDKFKPSIILHIVDKEGKFQEEAVWETLELVMINAHTYGATPVVSMIDYECRDLIPGKAAWDIIEGNIIKSFRRQGRYTGELVEA